MINRIVEEQLFAGSITIATGGNGPVRIKVSAAAATA